MTAAADLADLARKTERAYAGSITAGNFMTLGLQSGLFYDMPIDSGVRILNLPLSSDIRDGHNVVIRATGTSTYGNAYIQAPAGVNISYRSFNRSTFNMLGRGEVFRFTWIQAGGFWIAECLAQPGNLFVQRYHSNNGVWNGMPGNWNTMFFNGESGDTSAWGSSGYVKLTPVIGVYECDFRVRMSAAAGGGGSGYGYIAAAHPANNTVAQWLFQTYKNLNVNEDDSIFNANWTFLYDAGQYLNAFYLNNTPYVYHYYDANEARINLISR